jgi:hypothetical protein
MEEVAKFSIQLLVLGSLTFLVISIFWARFILFSFRTKNLELGHSRRLTAWYSISSLLLGVALFIVVVMYKDQTLVKSFNIFWTKVIENLSLAFGCIVGFPLLFSIGMLTYINNLKRRIEQIHKNQ